jgi:putative transposase
MVTPAAKREAVAHWRSAFEMSERRACKIISCVRMMVRYRSRRPDDAELRVRLRVCLSCSRLNVPTPGISRSIT